MFPVDNRVRRHSIVSDYSRHHDLSPIPSPKQLQHGESKPLEMRGMSLNLEEVGKVAGMKRMGSSFSEPRYNYAGDEAALQGQNLHGDEFNLLMFGSQITVQVQPQEPEVPVAAQRLSTMLATLREEEEDACSYCHQPAAVIPRVSGSDHSGSEADLPVQGKRRRQEVQPPTSAFAFPFHDDVNQQPERRAQPAAGGLFSFCSMPTSSVPTSTKRRKTWNPFRC